MEREVYICKCTKNVSEYRVRYNPTTLDVLLLCAKHSEMHDQGHGFNVHKWTEHQERE